MPRTAALPAALAFPILTSTFSQTIVGIIIISMDPVGAPWEKTMRRLKLLRPLTLALSLSATHGCGGDEETTFESDDAQPRPAGGDEGGNPMREGPAGCYIGAEMRCDCSIEEADCSDDQGGTWVAEGCASCAS